MSTTPQPTLAEIVAGLRASASIIETFDKVHAVGPASTDIALLRAAADRLEGLAKLAGEVRRDDAFVNEVYVPIAAHWLAARDCLIK